MQMLLKHPRIPHLPWSPGASEDDLKLSSVALFKKKYVTATIKMDGMNVTMYNNWIHARSVEYLMRHESTDLVKVVWNAIRHDIPENWRVCVENLYAKHSIHYKNLPDYFLVHSIWNDKNECLPWCETEEWAALLGFQTVPVIYCGMFDDTILRHMYAPTYQGDECEGFVVRLSDRFPYGFATVSMAKYVRAGHVQTDEHWLAQPIVKNELAGV